MTNLFKIRPSSIMVVLLSSTLFSLVGLRLYQGDIYGMLNQLINIVAGWMVGFVIGQFFAKEDSIGRTLTGYLIAIILGSLAIGSGNGLIFGIALGIAITAGSHEQQSTLYSSIITVSFLISLVLFFDFLPKAVLIALPQLGVVIAILGGILLLFANFNKIKTGALLLLTLFFVGWGAIFYNFNWISSKSLMPNEYQAMVNSASPAVYGDKIRQEAYGDVVISTLLPAHSEVMIYYRGRTFNGYLDVFDKLPYVRSITFEPLPSESRYLGRLWPKVSVRGVSDTPLCYDVVIIEDLPDQVTACDMLINEYILMAEGGFLVLPSNVEEYLSDKTKAKLQSFNYREILPYPTHFMVYSNKEIELDLYKLDEISTRFYPYNSFVPPKVFPFLVENIASESAGFEAKTFAWPQENIINKSNISDLKYFIPVLLLYMIFRLFFSKSELKRLALDNFENGLYAGVLASLLTTIMVASGLLSISWGIVLLVWSLLLLPLGSDDGFSWMKFMAKVLLFASPIFLDYSLILIMIIGLSAVIRPLLRIGKFLQIGLAPLYLILFLDSEPEAALIAAAGTLLANLMWFKSKNANKVNLLSDSQKNSVDIRALLGFLLGVIFVVNFGYNQYYSVAICLLLFRLPMLLRTKER